MNGLSTPCLLIFLFGNVETHMYEFLSKHLNMSNISKNEQIGTGLTLNEVKKIMGK